MKVRQVLVALLVPAICLLEWPVRMPVEATERPSPAAPASSPASSSDTPSSESLNAQWAEVKRLIGRGAYREALQTLEIILQDTPNDPRAVAYRSLCQQQLRSRPQFAQMSAGEFAALRESLEQERSAQRRAAAQAQALQQQVHKQQRAWDEDLKRLARESERQQKTTARLSEQQAARPAARGTSSPARTGPARSAAQARREEQAHQQALARAPARRSLEPGRAAAAPPTASAVVEPASAPAPPSLIEAMRPADVELEPVRVETEPAPAAPEEAAPLRPTRPEALPAGSVQILADQMRMQPERNLAIAEGHVQILFDDGFLTCDRVTLFTDTKDVYAQGRVYLERGKEVHRGDLVHYNTDTKKGRVLQGAVSQEPWHEYGRVIEHVAEGVLLVKSGYLTSCELEPPHFRFQGRSATVFSDAGIVRGRNVTLAIEEFPLIYLPWLSLADRQTPFFLIPGKKKPWEEFALMGYRYEWPSGHSGALRLDWRRAFGWGTGVDHRFDSTSLGRGLFKIYYNDEPNRRVPDPKASLPKGAADKRYRVLWRHHWTPLEDTTVVTDLQEYSDAEFRRDLLFREEFVEEGVTPESFISVVQNDPSYTATVLVKKRLNRFQSVTEAYPDFSLSTRTQRIGETNIFGSSSMSAANLQTRNAHSETDTDVIRLGWSQGLSYGLNWFRPVEMTPSISVQQTYYTKDKQGGAERPQGKRDVISGQFSTGLDASLKLFRLFPVMTNALGLNINQLRHVLTPTLAYSYVHRPTVPNDILNFAAAASGLNRLTFGVENKLQTKRQRQVAQPTEGQTGDAAHPSKPPQAQSVDIARFLISTPYTFRGHQNKIGGELGDWSFDLELFPWPWMRFETAWAYPSHFVKGSRDRRLTGLGFDWVIVGGRGAPQASTAPKTTRTAFVTSTGEPVQDLTALVMPEGQWFLGWNHSYSHNSKTEDAVQFDWRLSKKWEIGTFHRLTWKEVSGASKRFNHFREYQYTLRRDLHDWIAQLAYRVDREFGEEIFFTMTLKAYPFFPIALEEKYHQPKIGSQSSPFSPVGRF